MKLLLCSDFSDVGYKFLNRFFKDVEGLRCLFVGYASDDPDEENSGSAVKLKNMGIKVDFLNENYRFENKIDMIFVRGGNTTRLLHLLLKFNQFNKIDELVQGGVLYIGSSAGSILAGTDTEFTLRSEPYEFDLKQIYGENALKGYGWVDKLVFVHCSRYRMCWDEERENENDLFKTLDTFCYPAYLSDCRRFKKEEFIKVANNEAFYVNGDERKILRFNWKNLPFKIVKYEI